jgi:hypothetical protein
MALPFGKGKSMWAQKPVRPLAIYQDWLKKNGLMVDRPIAVMYKPTMELRWRGKVLEQKWVVSEMAYTHKWVAVRKRDRREPT